MTLGLVAWERVGDFSRCDGSAHLPRGLSLTSPPLLFLPWTLGRQVPLALYTPCVQGQEPPGSLVESARLSCNHSFLFPSLYQKQAGGAQEAAPPVLGRLQAQAPLTRSLVHTFIQQTFSLYSEPESV